MSSEICLGVKKGHNKQTGIMASFFFIRKWKRLQMKLLPSNFDDRTIPAFKNPVKLSSKLSLLLRSRLTVMWMLYRQCTEVDLGGVSVVYLALSVCDCSINYILHAMSLTFYGAVLSYIRNCHLLTDVRLKNISFLYNNTDQNHLLKIVNTLDKNKDTLHRRGDGGMGELTLPRPHMFCNDGHNIGVKNGGNIFCRFIQPL